MPSTSWECKRGPYFSLYRVSPGLGARNHPIHPSFHPSLLVSIDLLPAPAFTHPFICLSTHLLSSLLDPYINPNIYDPIPSSSPSLSSICVPAISLHLPLSPTHLSSQSCTYPPTHLSMHHLATHPPIHCLSITPSVQSSIHPSHPPIRLCTFPTHLSIYTLTRSSLFFQSSTHLSTCLLTPTHLLICPHTLPYAYTSVSIHLSIHSSILTHLFTHLPLLSLRVYSLIHYLFIYPSAHPYVCQSPHPPFSSSVLPDLSTLYPSMHPSVNLSSTAQYPSSA